MKTIMKTIYCLFAAFALVFFALLPVVQAVTPAPDGDYPNLNTAEGYGALFSLTTGLGNTADGCQALYFETIGRFNTAMGLNALFHNTSGSSNTGVGVYALLASTGDRNTAMGAGALLGNTTGYENTANGASALFHNGSGIDNTATGVSALAHNGGSYNTAAGAYALYENTTGSNNTADGSGALFANTGANNIAVGSFAGFNLTTGDNNIDIGNLGTGGESNTVRIGAQGTQTATYVAGIAGTGVDGSQVYVNPSGQLGIIVSSSRFKQNIHIMGDASDGLLGLRPVTFQYKNDGTNKPQFGLIAEEVAQINPDLVLRNAKGEIYSVRYDAVNAMLLNEFLKEHRKVDQLKSDFKARVAQQQREIQALTAQLKEQAAQIQRVSAQIEMSKPGLKVVFTKP